MKKSKLLILLIIFIAGFSLLKPGYFAMHDDLHIIRLDQMEKCFQDGQIPCRWTADMGFEYGLPLFNYYSPFPYYLGMVFRIFGLDFVLITKLLFLSAILISGFGMFFLAKEFSSRQGAILASTLFVLAPYRAVQIYVRGALTEFWAVSLLPLIFFFTYRYIKSKKFNYFLLSALSIFFFLICHNIIVILSLPLLLFWIGFLIVKNQSYQLIKNLLFIFVLSFGLSAFFLMPAFFERNLVSVEKLTSGYFNFRHHFVSLKQMVLSRNWGYGSSQPGVEDGLSFQIGWVHWILGIIGLFSGWPYLLFGLFGLFYTFMIHSRSIFIWELFPILGFVQFPWRLLGLVVFLFSAASAGIFAKLNRNIFRNLFLITVLLITIGLNYSYFSPEEYYPGLTGDKILTGDQRLDQTKGSINDYLPKQVKKIPDSMGKEPEVVQGKARIKDFRRKSNYFWFRVETLDDVKTIIQVPAFDFPHWQILIDRQPVNHQVNDQTGIIEINVPQGGHSVEGWFKNTTIRNLSNLITIFSFLVLLLMSVLVSREEK